MSDWSPFDRGFAVGQNIAKILNARCVGLVARALDESEERRLLRAALLDTMQARALADAFADGVIAGLLDYVAVHSDEGEET